MEESVGVPMASCCGGAEGSSCGCGDRNSREIAAVEVPCPLCGALREYFSDEVLAKANLRCRACGGVFGAEPFRNPAAGGARRLPV